MKYVFNDERSPLRLFSDGDAVRAYDILSKKELRKVSESDLEEIDI